ncbi:MAG TPA: hypothetical protein VJL81_14390 [Solirubrobacterales bacterium]|nr:hypothetical protein [Solirubrobacterales bacterium]
MTAGRANQVPVALWGGLLVAALTWQIGFGTPAVGLDASWNAGLAMAAADGLHFGKQIVFSYGPLGFLNSRLVLFGGQAVLSVIYAALLYLVFCAGLVWALRRAMPTVAALALAFVALAALPLPLLEVALLGAIFACFWLLEAERPPRALDAFVVAAATFAAPAALIKLSTGPLVAVVLFLALLGARAGRLRIAAFVVLLAVELAVLWLALGQSFADLPAFLHRTVEVAGGYSTAMLRSTDVAPWKVTAAVIVAILSGLALVGAAWFAGYRDRLARWAGMAIVALVSFAIYKEGVVRTDAGHLTLLFANAAVLWIAVGLGGRWPRLMLVGAVVVFALSLPVRPAGLGTQFDLVANVRFGFEQLRTLVSPARRAAFTDLGRATMQGTYAIPPAALARLQGHTVAVEPWETGAAWAYELDWQPQPVFQNYSAYTSGLDRLNAAALEDPAGPQRILRDATQAVVAEFPTPDIDNRFAGWDPPEQARAVLCNFVPLYTDERWQVLGRVPDRCGPQRPLGTVEAAAGQAVPVPTPGPDSVVFVRIDGAGVEGLERVTTFLLRAGSRHATVNGEARYRLVPETAGDGLLLRAAPGVTEPGPFDPVPEAKTLAVDGGADHLTYSFYEMPVRLAHVD